MNEQVVNSFSIIKRFNTESFINSMDFSNNGEYLVTASDDESMVLYNVETGRVSRKLYSKKYGVDLIRFTNKNPDEVICASKNEWDQTLRYLSMKDNKYIRYYHGHRDRVVSLEMSKSKSHFVSGSLDGTVRLWDLNSNICQGLLRLNCDNPKKSATGNPVACAFDPEGIVLAVAVGDNQVKLFDIRSLDQGPFSTFHVECDKKLDWKNVKFSPDGKYLLLSSPNALISIDSFEGTLLQKYEGHENSKGSPLIASFSPDGHHVLCGSEDGSIFVWGTQSGLIQSTWTGHSGPVGNVLCNPRYMVIASSCTNVAFWTPREDFENFM